MPLTIQSIFIDPPIAIARLGGSTVPQDAYCWIESVNPRTDGETVIAPAWSLDVLPDGSVEPRLPSTIRLRDGDLIRPVAPFFEVWALVGEDGSPASTWREVPVTPVLLAKEGAAESSITIRVDAKNRKAARRVNDANLVFGTFPAVSMRGDEHTPAVLRGVSPPVIASPMIPRGRSIPLGSLQIMRSRRQPADGTTAWTKDVNVEVIRFRFTPAQGRFYGPPEAARNTAQRPPAIEVSEAFLDSAAGWFGRAAGAAVQPSDTYDTVQPSSTRSLGIVDDTCEARIEVTVALGARARRVLTAHANVFVGPPDFAPDRRPFLSLADELNDRVAGAAGRDAALSASDHDHWVEDLFERIYETVSLLNVDFYRRARGLELTGDRLARASIPNDELPQPRQAMGGRDALRNPDVAVGAASDTEPLPLSEHARTRHRALSDIYSLREFITLRPGRLEALIRRPFEVEEGEQRGDRTTMRMPPFMRQSNALPLTLSGWQYELVMAWVRAVSPAAPPAAAIAPTPPTPRPMSRAAAERRTAVIARVDRPGRRDDT